MTLPTTPRQIVVTRTYWWVQVASGVGFMAVALLVGSVQAELGIIIVLAGLVVAAFMRRRMQREATALSGWAEAAADVTFGGPISEGEVVVRRVAYTYRSTTGLVAQGRFRAGTREKIPYLLPVLVSEAGGRLETIPIRSIVSVAIV